MHRNEPLDALLLLSSIVVVVVAGWTCTGNHPPGVWVIFASSSPTSRGIEGPVRSISRIPTDFPWRERERAS